MNKKIILWLGLGTIAGIASFFILPGSLATDDQPATLFLQGSCSDTCTVILDENRNGICEPGIDRVINYPIGMDAAGNDPTTFPNCP